MSTIENGICEVVGAAYPGATVENSEKVGFDPLHLLVTFGPVYQKATWEDPGLSKLVTVESAADLDAALGNKWGALQQVLGATVLHAADQAAPVQVTAVFADKGVLLSGYNGGNAGHDKHATQLAQHEDAYRQVFADFCASHGVASQFVTYGDLAVPLPSFVNPDIAIPGKYIDEDHSLGCQTADVIEALNTACQGLGIATELNESNKPTKKIIRQLVSAFGHEKAYWLALSYLAFDCKIPELVGEHGLPVYTERFAALRAIGKLTPSVAAMGRVGIPA
ncbi:MAG TPA: hypothetical protein VLF69_05685 [Candidatus Saccharimonadales bacterium]|nr:hypothetical protein [Candidatus Saccharimonadales bacterium]